jgi:phosphoglycerol transferase MdoB-like AlkP superfamily enzyme
MLLARIDTNVFMNITLQLIGIIAILFPILYFPYVVFVFVALLIKGLNNQNTKEIWIYSILSVLIYMGNLVWWNYGFA